MRWISPLLWLVFALPGCAKIVPKYDAKLDCDALKKVIFTVPEDFAPIVTAKSDTRFGSLWQTSVQAYGNSCSLVSSGTTPRAYFCSITDKDQKAAMLALADDVGLCLGPTWQRTELSRPATRFSRRADSVVVDVGASDVQASRSSAVGLIVRKL